jgi:hypothetical protein
LCGRDFDSKVDEDDARRRRRIVNRIRGRPADSLLAIAVGPFCSWAVLQSFGGHAGWTITPVLVAVIVVGGTLCALATALTGVPRRIVRGGAYFWESVTPSAGVDGLNAFLAASFYACVSIAWGVALVLLFGTRPAGT